MTIKKVNKQNALFAIITLLLFIAKPILAQPTPGDTGLGAASGGVVGGGADLVAGVWLWLIPLLMYFLYKWRTVIMQWYLAKN